MRDTSVVVELDLAYEYVRCQSISHAIDVAETLQDGSTHGPRQDYWPLTSLYGRAVTSRAAHYCLTSVGEGLDVMRWFNGVALVPNDATMRLLGHTGAGFWVHCYCRVTRLLPREFSIERCAAQLSACAFVSRSFRRNNTQKATAPVRHADETSQDVHVLQIHQQ